MTPVEYRVEYVHFDTNPESGSPNAQLVARLNECARQGWRVCHVDMTPHPQSGWQGRPLSGSEAVLLEREVPIGRTESPTTKSELVGSVAH